MVLADPAATGLDALVAALLREAMKNPSKVALLEQMRGTVTLTIPDQDAEIGLRFADGVATVLPSAVPGAMLRLSLPSPVLASMGSTPVLPFVGIPSPLSSGGRDLYKALLTRAVRIGGAHHVVLLNQVTSLLRVPPAG